MPSLVKTIQPEALSIQQINANAAATKSAEVVGISTALACTIFWDFAPLATTASVNPTQLSVQTSQKASGNDTWVDILSPQSPTSVPVSGAQTGSSSIGASTIVAATGTFTLGQYIFIQDPTFTNSEWAKLVGQSGTTLTLENPLTYAHSGATIWSYAQRYVYSLSLDGIQRLRFVVLNNLGTTCRPVAVRVAITTTDSI